MAAVSTRHPYNYKALDAITGLAPYGEHIIENRSIKTYSIKAATLTEDELIGPDQDAALMRMQQMIDTRLAFHQQRLLDYIKEHPDETQSDSELLRRLSL